MDKFNFYELVGIIVPGIFFGIGLTYINPGFGSFVQRTFGGVGGAVILVSLAYPVGFILKELGSALERPWWFLQDGKPTHWVLRNRERLLTHEQRSTLREKISNIDDFPVPNPDDEGRYPRDDLKSIRRQIYAYVERQGNTDRVDRFRGNYAMNRNILAATMILFIGYIVEFGVSITVGLVALSGFALFAGIGMQRAAKHYASALYIQFLDAEG